MKICLLCGTFNPIHNGHLAIASFVQKKFNFEKVIFIPSYISPFKQNLDKNIALKRLEMVKLAVKNINKFDFSDIEYNLDQVSYTYNTICAIYNKYTNQIEGKINFIIGYDAFFKVDNWHKTEELKKLVKFLVCTRNVQNSDDINEKFNILKENGYDFELLDFSPVDISSSQIRQNIKINKTIDSLVPKEVREYIYEKNLYRE